MTVLLCSVFSILRYKEHKPYFHRNILYSTWTGSSNPQLFRTVPPIIGGTVRGGWVEVGKGVEDGQRG